MGCQSQPDLVVANVDVGVMIHPFSEPRNSIDEFDALHEVFEDVELGNLLASKLPTSDFRQFSSDLLML